MDRLNTSDRRAYRIDALQYCNWSRETFLDMRAGGLDGVHATVAYHENFRQCVDHLIAWNRYFALHGDLILRGRDAADIRHAAKTGRTAVFFGSQNPSVIEQDIGLIEVLRDLGLVFMQLSYNNQSLLCSGWWESPDGGLTRMGREVIAEMNRVGMVVDMSHSGERSTLDAIEASARPIAVTHANPSAWRETGRNKSGAVLSALAKSGGMLGLSLYPHHLKDGSACTLESFCQMAAELALQIGAGNFGIGSDLCHNQPDRVVEWMRSGRWTFGKTESVMTSPAVFPAQPEFFRSNRDFPNIRHGLEAVGFSAAEVDGIMGENWLRFMEASLSPQAASLPSHAS